MSASGSIREGNKSNKGKGKRNHKARRAHQRRGEKGRRRGGERFAAREGRGKREEIRCTHPSVRGRTEPGPPRQDALGYDRVARGALMGGKETPPGTAVGVAEAGEARLKMSVLRRDGVRPAVEMTVVIVGELRAAAERAAGDQDHDGQGMARGPAPLG